LQEELKRMSEADRTALLDALRKVGGLMEAESSADLLSEIENEA
jgi:hypothetical protein